MALHGAEAIEKAIIGYTQRQIANAPPHATGVYIGRDIVSYGYRTNRDDVSENYIFFDAPPPPIQSYNEHIQAWRKTDEEKVLVQMNWRQAHVLSRMSEHIGGKPSGPRGVFNKLYDALRSVGADESVDDSLDFGDDSYFYIESK